MKLSHMKKLCLGAIFILPVNYALAMSQTDADNFQKAEVLLNKNDMKAYYQLKAKLSDTALYSYLQYQEITKDISQFDTKTIDRYLKDNTGSYWAYLLKQKLALYYAQKENWQNFEKYYEENLGVSGQCYNLQAKYVLNQRQAALNEFTTLWLSRVSLPSACDRFEKIWLNEKTLSEAEIRQKAFSLAGAGKLTEALYWIKKTNDKTRIRFYTLWQNANKNPKKYLDDFTASFHKFSGFNSAFLSIMDNLSRADSYYTIEFWQSFKQKKLLSKRIINLVEAEIAIDLARAHNKLAIKWLAKIDNQYASTLLWQWRFRTALYWSNYADYLAYYQKAPSALKNKTEWQYWQARVNQKLGKMNAAKPVFEKLAAERSYYGFLSADILEKPYAFNDKTIKVSSSVLAKVEKNSAIQAAFDLYQLKDYQLSYNLWRFELKGKSNSDILAAAKLAENQKIYQLSVYAYANGGAGNDLTVRFPIAFQSEVKAASKRFHLDESLIYAIMRKESMYRIKARSYVGAGGLMQLMPTTAKFLSDKYKLNINMNEWLNPNASIMLGAANLNFMDKLFSDNKVLGVSSYNAGQGNVANWLTNYPMDGDQWIETIPFGETRNYAKLVFAYMTIYESEILNNKKFRLSSVITQVSKKDKS